MGDRYDSEDTLHQLERLIKRYAEIGIDIKYLSLPEDKLLSIVIREVVPESGHHHAESELWNLALYLFRSVDLLKEIRAVPVRPHVVEKRGAGLVFRRLINPEVDCGIQAGEGPYQFVIHGRPYHLEVLPEFAHNHMTFFASEARAAIQRQGMADGLP